MEYFVIGDEDTVLGFRYAGVPGRAVRAADEARAALAEPAARQAGIIVVTDAVAEWVPEEVNALRFKSRAPIVVQVPGPSGPSATRTELTALIRAALGIQL